MEVVEAVNVEVGDEEDVVDIVAEDDDVGETIELEELLVVCVLETLEDVVIVLGVDVVLVDELWLETA